MHLKSSLCSKRMKWTGSPCVLFWADFPPKSFLKKSFGKKRVKFSVFSQWSNSPDQINHKRKTKKKQYGEANDGPGIILSSPIPLWVQYIPVTLYFTLHVYAVTAAHHYGPAWANFNGCHRQQGKTQACQRKQQTGAKKDGLLCGG